MLTGQRSQQVRGPTGQPHLEADTWSPQVRLGKRKRVKGLGFVFGLKVMGRLDLAHQLGSARRPARLRLAGRLGVQQAGFGFGFIAADASSGPVAPWAVLGWAASPPSPPLLADWAVPRVGLGRNRCSSAWIWCGRQGCVCACVGVVAVCAQPHARRSVGRDARVRQAATSRGRA
jgi:hypothetical protein